MRSNPVGSPYPEGFIYGRGEARPSGLSLAGLKISRCLKALDGIQGEVLELGCGGGQYLKALRRYRPELDLHAVDLAPDAVNAAAAISGVVCQTADVAALPYPKNKFSAVLGFDILEHVADPARVLREAFRVLVLGGRLHLYIPCEGNAGTIYMRRNHALKARWGGHKQQFTTEQISEMVRQEGFAIISLRHADYWLTQQFDYAFFSRLAGSAHSEEWWAAQSLSRGGGIKGWGLRLIRRVLSVISWLEGTVRRNRKGAMGVHLTAQKKKRLT